ncbi:glutamate 5-kinase [Helicobacter cholecystus]|uniref:Glutamate 5-kinase n=1 Tax=Helicobacter cholecystus TaxID=45498 RepID=A0A3D8IVQ5_9HELI|nr:glutamate 5-kinase [Helicobacter cholecystus]RDU68714.1 glutamate 5-kinase [Helicobacter cholecystus]VEJ26185.1 gamma-glutamyl kinase [Helicobacter cholecystus]
MKRIVIKIGTSNLSDGEKIWIEAIERIAQSIARLSKKFEIILVTSGAVASGYTKLRLDKSKIASKQALASIGQPLLLETYRKVFEKYSILNAQILLCGHDFDSRSCTQNAKDTIEILLSNKVLPIINENDSLATAELKFGDNDRLSAHVAYYFDADLLVILSDIDGYYDKNPHQYSDAKLIKTMSFIPEENLKTNYDPHGHFATGGIVTKLIAADFLIQRGKRMFLCNGQKLEILERLLLEGIQESGTIFGEQK